MAIKSHKKKSVRGLCHLCGSLADLNYEHVPPKAAGNRDPVLRAGFVEAMGLGLDGSVREVAAEKEQAGAGYYSFCPECNKNMGLWYVPAYGEWTKQASKILSKFSASLRGTFFEFDISPLSCLKQIVAMFFAINTEKMRELYPDLAQLVLDKEAQGLPSGSDVYMYLVRGGVLRYMGVTGQIRKDKGIDKPILLSEISFPPFGFVLCLRDYPAPDERLHKINHFADYGYGAKHRVALHLHELPVHLPLPGDYRTKAEIRAHEDRERLRRLGLHPPR